MRKCIRCNIVFRSQVRTRCLYCDVVLVSINQEAGLIDGKQIDNLRGTRDYLESSGRGELDRKQFMMGSYFRSRTYSFVYAFCRNDLRQGKGYPRFFVRPLDFSSLFSLPWFLISVIDSLFFRLSYIGFCEKCQYKYQPQGDIVGHEKKDCDYCLEYSAIVQDIMTGKIATTEDDHVAKAKEKVEQGVRSAYNDLCAQKKGADAFFDVLSIWLTICLVIYLLVRLLSPVFNGVFHQIEQEIFGEVENEN